MGTPKDYAIVSPAKNEEQQIRETLKSVISQTVLPVSWVIVSDGSTDRTDEIVREYAERHDFIQLVRREKSATADQIDFRSKVAAFNLGYAALSTVDYDFVGNLDADVSFEPDYFELLLGEFEADPRLGLAGGMIYEKVGDSFMSQKTSRTSVAGAVQLFRRECYEAVGGYVPIQHGGEDSSAEILAKMHGWTVETIPALQVMHHGRVVSGNANVLKARYYRGVTLHVLGYHPIFMIAASAFRALQRPYVIGGILMYAGYLSAAIRRVERRLPNEAVTFLRREQMARLSPRSWTAKVRGR